ncbi:hypothetical protein FXO38_01856 [Capsicum annuum]|nr:hypothetical protein FXO38_01856 [Capsicum annuum]
MHQLYYTIQGPKKSVIITLETTYKGGWGNIAQEIEKFIYEPGKKQESQPNITRKQVVIHRGLQITRKWMTEAMKEVRIQIRDVIKISRGTATSGKDLLNRCIVGELQQASFEVSQLNDVRRWQHMEDK